MTDEAGFAGQKFFVPGFRIVRLGALPSSGPGEALPPDVAFDVLSVSVTQNNTGMSTYQIVLNNSHLSTGAERARSSSGGSTTSSGVSSSAASGGFSRETFAGANPAWPRYKYNDLFFFEFGQRLRIDMRYLPEVENRPQSDGSPRPVESNALALRDEWTPMIAGPITDIKFDLVASAEEKGLRVTVSGHDDLSRLKDFQDWRCDLDRYSEIDAVRHILSELGLSLPFAQPLVAYPPFVNDATHGIQLSRNPNQSSFEFLSTLAQRLDFEMFVAFDLRANGHPLELHFEPYRGRAAPEDARRLFMRLERGQILLKLDTKIDVAAQYTDVSVRGRHRETAQVIEARGRARADSLRDELRAPPSGTHGPIEPAPVVRTHYYPGRPNPFDPGNQERLDSDRAEWRATAIMRQKARELCVLNGETIGIPRLRAGNHVEMRHCRPPFDGYYYLTRTVHTVNSQGYRTTFTASRPGLEIPDSSHHFVETPA